ncbi:MAG: DNA polymerase I [Syntrophaceae bacterium]|nr:DNA polymerase I [Syntrophaceae bacterium]
MGKTNEEIYLIDGSAYIFRAYHAMGGLSNSKGFPTGAIFGFTNMIMKTLKDKSPTRIAVVFDAPGPTFRHEMYPLYKANRPEAPQDLIVQIPKILELVQAYRLPMLSIAGYEADDIIATLTQKARSLNWGVVIVSADKDLTQLVCDGVAMWDPQKDALYDAKGVKDKFGVLPEQILDYLSLVGDSSDNIPGVRGIGPKTAGNLIQDFGSLQQIYDQVDRITKPKLRESLMTNRDKAFLSRELAKLDEDVPIDIDIKNLIILEPDSEHLREMFRELEFKRLLDNLPAVKNLDFSGYKTVRTLQELPAIISEIKANGRFAVDLETTSIAPVWAELVGISLCAKEGEPYYLPVGHIKGPQLPKGETLTMLKPIFEDPAISKIGQNIKYDMIVLKNEGVGLRGVACDTMLASYLLDPSRRGHSLDDLAEIYLEHKMIPITDLIGTGKKQISFAEVEIDQASEYSCEDADVTFRLATIMTPRLEEAGLEDLFLNVELPVISVLTDMELVGVRIDSDYLKKLSIEFGENLKQIEREIYDLAGEEFNINSTQQVGEILFNKLGLKGTKKTKTGLSTSLAVLEELAFQHELPKKILEYRSIFKLKSTYADSLVNLVNPRTGRIHTSYNQAVAATGRLSSSDPNLQNIPIRTTEGRKIRKAFVPAKNHVFIAADYSQIELRIMAHLSQDKRLLEAFDSGEDIHSITAASVFGLPLSLVTPEMRRKAKEINFGIIYGMGAFKLSNQIGVSLKVARQYLEDYYLTYAGVKKYMEEVPDQASRVGFVTTILGRKRFLPDLTNPNKMAQQAARRIAINTTMQGSAADLMKVAMINVHKRLEAENLPVELILQVHDELVLEAHENHVDAAINLLRFEMEHAYELSVPLVVDVSVGNNWDEAH